MSLRVVHVVGARPNFMKIAPVMRALDAAGGVEQSLVHTGQHYDPALSDVFFAQLGLPQPDANLGVGSASHAAQTAEMMRLLDEVLPGLDPDWVVVPGDVNSTLAAALVAVKRGLRVAHVEAGLRSNDLTMPEEINRIVVDRLAHLLLTPSRDADENLLREGRERAAIRFVGNVMIDTLAGLLPLAEEQWPELRDRLGLDGPYVAVTLHRPANVDDPAAFEVVADALHAIAEEVDVVFPMHPRTRDRAGAGLQESGRLRIVEPLGYLDFLALESHSAAVLTDSGGIQEETTWLGIPCLTLRTTTERPITVTEGTNRLVPLERDAIADALREALERGRRTPSPPELWDGRAAERVAAELLAAS